MFNKSIKNELYEIYCIANWLNFTFLYLKGRIWENLKKIGFFGDIINASDSLNRNIKVL